MEKKMYRVQVLWDPQDESSLSSILIQADKRSSETEEPPRNEYYLCGIKVLDVPEANFRGDYEETSM